MTTEAHKPLIRDFWRDACKPEGALTAATNHIEDLAKGLVFCEEQEMVPPMDGAFAAIKNIREQIDAVEGLLKEAYNKYHTACKSQNLIP